MKYEVIATFKDKYTGEIFEKGAKIEIAEGRAKEILSAGKFIKAARAKRKA